MNNFIYFNNQFLRLLITTDFNIESSWHPLLQNRHWNEQIGHVVSRVHDIDSPVPLSGTICPMPRDIAGTDLDFGRVMDGIADHYCRQIVRDGQRPYLFYSGGIDSVSILVSLLRTGNREFLDRLTIVCSRSSFHEAPRFYDRYIRDRFQIIDTDNFAVDPDDHDDIVVLDGEMGNQTMGSCGLYDFVRKGKFDQLAGHYDSIKDIPMCAGDRYIVDLVFESLPYAPVEISTLHDFFWWSNFNFKVDEVLLRKLLTYTDAMTDDQRQRFFSKNLIRPYAHESMQRWSLASLEQRRHSLRMTTKYFPKKYIFDFDRDEIWYSQKREVPSSSRIFLDKNLGSNFIIGIDQHWRLWDIRDRTTRQHLQPLLDPQG